MVQQENELKLKMLHALVDSQRALATMMEQISQIVVISEPTARHILNNLHSMTAYQKVMADKIAFVHLKQIRCSKPVQPWLTDAVRIRVSE